MQTHPWTTSTERVGSPFLLSVFIQAVHLPLLLTDESLFQVPDPLVLSLAFSPVLSLEFKDDLQHLYLTFSGPKSDLHLQLICFGYHSTWLELHYAWVFPDPFPTFQLRGHWKAFLHFLLPLPRESNLVSLGCRLSILIFTSTWGDLLQVVYGSSIQTHFFTASINVLFLICVTCKRIFFPFGHGLLGHTEKLIQFAETWEIYYPHEVKRPHKSEWCYISSSLIEILQRYYR